MSEIEREVKILNVDIKETITKMNKLGVSPKGKYIQDIYTFNFPSIENLFKYKLKIAENTGDREQLIDFINEIKPCFSKEDIELIKSICKTDDIIEYVNNEKDLSLLDNSKIYDLLKKVNKNYSKWIRLRRTGDKTTITIKRIVNCCGEYELDAVRELEFEVPSIDEGKEFLKILGYYPALHQKKMRIAYDYNNTEVVLDKWPKIPAYIEVEGKSPEDIYKVVSDLGFSQKDVRVMNTDDVYRENGLDIYSFKDLDFSEKEQKEVEEIIK